MRDLTTKRLLLRHFRMEDAEPMFQNWASDPEVTRYLSWLPHPDVSETKERLAKWIGMYDQTNVYQYAIENRESGELMGSINVVGFHHGNPVIGYASGKRFWNHGYMTEALGALTSELIKDGYETIVIEAADPNIGSNRVIEKNGFELVGTWEQKVSDFKDLVLPTNSYRLFTKKRMSGDYNDLNSETIDRWVDEGWAWGKPISHEDYVKAKNGDWQMFLTPTKPVPKEWFGEIRGKRMLGLASGGAQQMPVFQALGAECWVLDFSERQIASEKAVAEREGYRIHAIRADMTKPLPFSDGFFDMIFHPVSNCYIRDVEPVWKECARILKP
ncbi:MAG: GNAT family N-acetyltransferase, partial [Lachnospiraceae bacterium]|nr:GNAT family N-acetyltransferase [Lachnospiraceae bacterium]